MNKVNCLILIFVLTSSLFADVLLPKYKWQIANEDSLKKKTFFLDSLGNSDNYPSRSQIYTKEFVYALGLSACCVGTEAIFAVGLALVLAFQTPGGQEVPSEILVMALIPPPAIAALGTYQAAKWNYPGGSYSSSCLGAYCGSLLGIGISYAIVSKYGLDIWGGAFYSGLITYSLCTSVGAVIGYNLSVPKKSGQGFHHRHFDLPTFSMKTEKTQEGKIINAFDFRLINARF